MTQKGDNPVCLYSAVTFNMKLNGAKPIRMPRTIDQVEPLMKTMTMGVRG